MPAGWSESLAEVRLGMTFGHERYGCRTGPRRGRFANADPVIIADVLAEREGTPFGVRRCPFRARLGRGLAIELMVLLRTPDLLGCLILQRSPP
jgi:hypothetical protein